jgi:hypothetical protein
MPEPDFRASESFLQESGMAEMEIEIASEFGGMDQNGVGGQGLQFE